MLASYSLWRHYRRDHNIRGAGRIHHPLLSSSLTGLFWSVHSGKNTVFLLLSWRALARRLRSVWIRVFVIWHPMTHTIVASFVWARSTHAMSLRGQLRALRALWAVLYEKAPLSSRLFEERGSAVYFPRFESHRCRGTEENEIVGFAGGSGRWVREGAFPFAWVGRERGRAAELW